jgi:hypothetical protein
MTGAVLVASRPKERDIMHYAILIYVDEKLYAEMSKEESDAHQAANSASVETNHDRIKVAAALHHVDKATTVRIRDGKTLTIDRPFAETKEQLGGFCLVECDNLDEAIEMAAHIPDAVRGSIEVRPVWGYHEA